MRRLIYFSMVCLLTITSLMNPSGIAKGKNIHQPKLIASAVAPYLEFTVINSTGYDIKGLYMAPASSEEWDKEEELLKGRTFKNGGGLVITFSPRVQAEQFDLMVVWADGSANSVWNEINLEGTSKLTLTYDRPSDTTSISRE